MSVTLTIDQNQTVTQADDTTLYTITMEVVGSEGIEMDVFVFDMLTMHISRIATITDMSAYPVGLLAAQEAGVDYYRGRSLSLSFTSALEAMDTVTIIHQRLTTLVTDANRLQSDFEVGEQTLTFSSVS